jgi:hypothetical protein
VVSLTGIGGLDKADIPAGVIVVVLAILGVALSIKHYERNRMHTRILRAIREEITRLDENQKASPCSTQDIRDAAVAEHRKEFAVLEKRKKDKKEERAKSPWPGIRLHILWLGLPAAIGVVGVLVIVLAIVGVTPPS